MKRLSGQKSNKGVTSLTIRIGDLLPGRNGKIPFDAWRAWCTAHCSGKVEWHSAAGPDAMFIVKFEEETDAVMFSLTWL